MGPIPTQTSDLDIRESMSDITSLTNGIRRLELNFEKKFNLRTGSFTYTDKDTCIFLSIYTESSYYIQGTAF